MSDGSETELLVTDQTTATESEAAGAEADVLLIDLPPKKTKISSKDVLKTEFYSQSDCNIQPNVELKP